MYFSGVFIHGKFDCSKLIISIACNLCILVEYFPTCNKDTISQIDSEKTKLMVYKMGKTLNHNSVRVRI